MTGPGRLPSITGPGLLLGVGVGMFVDGIVLHQLLQWHHLVSARRDAHTLAGLQLNTLADGVLHAAALVALLVGLALLWLRTTASTGPWSRSSLLWLVVAGMGLFNIFDGVVDHYLLGLHHVREDVPDPLPWDLGFLLIAVLLAGAGLLLHRRAQRRLVVRATTIRRGRR